MKIGFCSYQLGNRGTETALYDYALYNQTLLNNESVIISTYERPAPTYSKFKKDFKVILHGAIWNELSNAPYRRVLSKIVDEEKIDFLYFIKGGEDDGVLPDNCKTGAHCVFNLSQPHGTVYAAVSKYLCNKWSGKGKFLYVPHMINLPSVYSNLREELGIPSDALVFGRHGGYETFNIDFVKDAVKRVLGINQNIYFVFVNTERFVYHDRIRFLDPIIDLEEKVKFINTCDAMLHARSCGESFGIAVGEFSIKNIPVITFDGGLDTAHLDILGAKSLRYSSQQQLIDILLNFKLFKSAAEQHIDNWDAYSAEYNPEKVMDKFRRIFLD